MALLAIVGLLFSTPPRLLQIPRVLPDYSEEARRARVEGTVVLSVTIGTDGLVKEITVAKSLGYGLDESAMKAVRTWKFTPATNDQGNAAESNIPIECNFYLLTKE